MAGLAVANRTRPSCAVPGISLPSTRCMNGIGRSLANVPTRPLVVRLLDRGFWPGLGVNAKRGRQRSAKIRCCPGYYCPQRTSVVVRGTPGRDFSTTWFKGFSSSCDAQVGSRLNLLVRGDNQHGNEKGGEPAKTGQAMVTGRPGRCADSAGEILPPAPLGQDRRPAIPKKRIRGSSTTHRDSTVRFARRPPHESLSLFPVILPGRCCPTPSARMSGHWRSARPSTACQTPASSC